MDDVENWVDASAGGKFVVANFHTHFPLCYAAFPCQRTPCGPTQPSDYTAAANLGVPAFVYDYVGSINSTEKIDKPAKVYYFGSISSRRLPNY